MALSKRDFKGAGGITVPLTLLKKEVVSLGVSHFLAKRSDKLTSLIVESVLNVLMYC